MHIQKVQRQCILIFLAIVFIIGIFANLSHMETVSGRVFDGNIGFLAEQSFFAAEPREINPDAKVLPIDSFHEMDDFYIAHAHGRSSRNESETVKGAVFIIAVAILLVICTKRERYQVNFGEGRIEFFHIVSFIHRIDGKKKNLFWSTVSNKTGGQENGSWNKI
ncbi:MAG: hypothetical protein J6A75_07355 [Lachnospiraceae bacterium]|nr:hypothetical protein [Lachnospiraceae bacterium]